MNNKIRIYSRNLGAYLLANGVEIIYKMDEEGKVYLMAEVSKEVEELVEKYKADEQLHKFISSFNEIRTGISNEVRKKMFAVR